MDKAPHCKRYPRALQHSVAYRGMRLARLACWSAQAASGLRLQRALPFSLPPPARRLLYLRAALRPSLAAFCPCVQRALLGRHQVRRGADDSHGRASHRGFHGLQLRAPRGGALASAAAAQHFPRGLQPQPDWPAGHPPRLHGALRRICRAVSPPAAAPAIAFGPPGRGPSDHSTSSRRCSVRAAKSKRSAHWGSAPYQAQWAGVPIYQYRFGARWATS